MTTATPEHPFIDEKLALDLIDKAVAERGKDFVYSTLFEVDSCIYAGIPGYLAEDVEEAAADEVGFIATGERQAGCIVGVGLHQLGWSLDELEDMGDGAIDDLINNGNLRGSPNAAEILRAAQDDQDKGRAWGVAQERAHRKAAALGVQDQL